MWWQHFNEMHCRVCCNEMHDFMWEPPISVMAGVYPSSNF